MSLFVDYAHYYDVYYASKDYESECDFIEAAFARFGRRPHSLLDLACGTANHGLRLAKRGYKVCGIDRSPQMLARCSEKAQSLGLEIELHEQDMRRLNLERQFDSAICMFDAIDYLPDNSDLDSFLRCVRAQVKPAGLFVFDFWHAVPLLRGYDPVRVREFPLAGGRLLRISTTTLDIAQQVAKVEFRVLVFHGDHLTEEFSEVHPMRYFLPQEMRFILAATGWRVCHLCPTFDLDAPVDENAWHLAAIATPATT